jgi:hypothetical protein
MHRGGARQVVGCRRGIPGRIFAPGFVLAVSEPTLARLPVSREAARSPAGSEIIIGCPVDARFQD